MKKLLLLVILVGICVYALMHYDIASILRTDRPEITAEGRFNSNEMFIENAYKEKKRNLMVKGKGKVVNLLSDSIAGGRCQRFEVLLASGRIVTIKHNINIAPKISNLKIGDSVEFSGIYDWNSKGGNIGQTHLDPKKNKHAGWIIHGGRKYQ